MPGRKKQRANLKARNDLLAILREHSDEANMARSRVGQRIEQRREEMLHRRQCEAEDRLIGIERAKRVALRWLRTRSRRHRPPRTEDIPGLSDSRPFSISRRMGVCGVRKLGKSPAKNRSRAMRDLAEIESLDAYLEIYADWWFKRCRYSEDRRPSRERLMREEREIITRRVDEAARPALLIGGFLATMLDEGLDASRADEAWWEAATMLALALEPSQEGQAFEVCDLRQWGCGGLTDQDAFTDPREIATGVRAHLTGSSQSSVIASLHELVDAAVETLRGRTADQTGSLPKHIAELRKTHAAERRGAEQRKAVAHLQRLAWDCTRHVFATQFLPPHYEENETVPQWMARVDWDAYPRAWMDLAIRPFLRELRLRAPRLKVDVEVLLRYEGHISDQRLRDIQDYMAGFTRRMFAALDDARQQLDLEEELVRTFAKGKAGRECYHHYFEYLCDRVPEPRTVKEEVPLPSPEDAPKPTAEEPRLSPQERSVLLWLAQQTERKQTGEIARALGVRAQSIGKGLVRLRELGYIENPGRRGYLATSSGKALAANPPAQG